MKKPLLIGSFITRPLAFILARGGWQTGQAVCYA